MFIEVMSSCEATDSINYPKVLEHAHQAFLILNMKSKKAPKVQHPTFKTKTEFELHESCLSTYLCTFEEQPSIHSLFFDLLLLAHRWHLYSHKTLKSDILHSSSRLYFPLLQAGKKMWKSWITKIQDLISAETECLLIKLDWRLHKVTFNWTPKIYQK